MKNFTFFLLTGLFSLQASISQAQFSLGVRGGVTHSKFLYDGDLDSLNEYINTRSGYLFGMVMEMRLNQGFAIQPEINYTQRGTTEQYTSNNYKKTRYNYLEIPVLVKAGLKAGPFRLDLLGGPSFSYALNGSNYIRRKILSVIYEERNEFDFSENEFDDFSRFELGLQGGAALSVGAGNGRFFVDGRYHYGVTDLDSDNEFEIKNRGTILTAGAIFAF